MKSRPLTVQEQYRFTKLYDLGCIVCWLEMGIFTPTAIHHIAGKTKKGCHQQTIPLCSLHHQTPCNDKPKIWISRHGDGKCAFEDAYGSENYLLDETNKRILL